jgi:DNA-binding response OmpR family regulator
MAKLLVIEDDEQFCQMLGQMLDQAGHEVEMAANGVIGMERFRDSSPDLVITDILMPEQDGIDTILAMKKERGKRQDYCHVWGQTGYYPAIQS